MIEAGGGRFGGLDLGFLGNFSNSLRFFLENS